MRNYASLSPADFERLVRDLLQSEWGGRLETFPGGPDGGVDVRLLNGSRRVGVQCKHYPHGSWATLRGSLRREARRTPLELDEFWLVTSASLTARAKEEASTILAGQGLTPRRVLGRDDVENLLNLHPEIEQRHLHLHTTSVPLLRSFLHQGLSTRRELLEDRIAEHTSGLARIDVVDVALDTLSRLGHCTITGPPGIGKTALAEILLNDFLSRGYELNEIVRPDELEAAWHAERSQVFFSDDVLGQLAVEPRLGRVAKPIGGWLRG